MIDLELLIKNGVQFGHQAWRVCPKMKPYIWGEKNGIHLIDVSKTAQQIEKATQFLEEVAARGEPILWVGTKKAAQPVIEQAAQKLSAPYVSNRWIGGTLTNFSEVKKAILKLKHYESLLEHSEKQYTKKEYGRFRKVVDRVEDNVGGIRNISWPIGALVVVDAKKEQVAVKEAQRMGIPVVALTDTNTDPSGIDYVIPGNDDIARSVRTVLDPLAEAASRGMQKAEQVAAQKQQQAEQEQQAKASTKEEPAEKAEASEKAEKETAASEEKQESTDQKKSQTQQKASAQKEQTDETAEADSQAQEPKKQTSKTATKSSQAQSATKASTSKTGTGSKSTKSTSSASTSKKTTTTKSSTAKSSSATSAKSSSATSKKADTSKKTQQSEQSTTENADESSQANASDQSAE